VTSKAKVEVKRRVIQFDACFAHNSTTKSRRGAEKLTGRLSVARPTLHLQFQVKRSKVRVTTSYDVSPRRYIATIGDVGARGGRAFSEF